MGKFRIEIGPKNSGADPKGALVLSEIKEDLGIELRSVAVVRVLELVAAISLQEARALCTRLFVDPIMDVFSLNAPLFAGRFDFSAQVGFLPGVTDNVGLTARRTIGDFLGRKMFADESVKSATLYLLSGNISEQFAVEIASKKLFNPLIEQVQISRSEAPKGSVLNAEF